MAATTVISGLAIMVVVVMMMVVMIAVAVMIVVMVVVVVGLRLGQHSGEPALQSHGRLARGIRRFYRQSHDLRSQPKIINLAQIMASQSALPVEYQQCRRALHAVGGHRLRQARFTGHFTGHFTGRIYADRKFPAVLLDKRFQSERKHRSMVLENRVQSDHRHRIAVETRSKAACLGQSMGNASRAEHLECQDYGDTPLQCSQRRRIDRIQPTGDLEFRW